MAIIAKHCTCNVNWGFGSLNSKLKYYSFIATKVLLLLWIVKSAHQMPWNKFLERFRIFLSYISSIKKTYKLITSSSCNEIIVERISMNTKNEKNPYIWHYSFHNFYAILHPPVNWDWLIIVTYLKNKGGKKSTYYLWPKCICNHV